MGRVKKTIVQLTGKFDDKLIVDSAAYGMYVRTLVEEGSKKNEPALKLQYSRTKFLNNLASEVNQIVQTFGSLIKFRNFYTSVLSRFRKEPLNNRFLLLQQLKGMELSERYPRAKFGDCVITGKELKNIFRINLKVETHPYPLEHNADCYYYELLFATWAKGNKKPIGARMASDWILMKDPRPEFDFDFKLPPGTVHWMVCVRQILGVNKTVIENMEAEGLQIMEVGTRDKKDEAILIKRAAEPKNPEPKKAVETLERVKAKKK